MIAVIQRVSQGAVEVDGQVSGSITNGLVILLGVVDDDEEKDADFLTDKISKLRIFNDNHGKMNISILDIGGSALVISQFTLCGDWRKGNRPSYIKAAPPEKGRGLYEYFITALRSTGVPVETGVFGAKMDVSLINDGPVTFVLDSRKSD